MSTRLNKHKMCTKGSFFFLTMSIVTWNCPAEELTPTFTLFFQASLKQGIIPTDWTTANVVPIFKKGDRQQPNNYRPISLTSITCQMLEHIITSNIMQHLDTHHILHDAQHGFRKHRSTETQLIQLIDNLAHNIDNRIQTDAILLDFQKAFDKVPHQRLIYKLTYYMASHHKHSTGYTHFFLTAHSRSSWRAILLPPSTSLQGCPPRKCSRPYPLSNLHKRPP